MKLIFQSIPLSFAVLWRLMILLPFLGAFAFFMITGFGFIGSIWALISAIMATTIASITAIRAGLAARDVWTPPVFNRLIVASFKYGIFFQIVYILFSVLAGLLIVTLSIYGFSDLNSLLIGKKYVSDLDVLSGASTLLYTLAVLGLVFMVFHTGMLVPLAAASYGVGEKVEDFDFFWGFGAGFFGLFVISMFTTIATFAIGVPFAFGQLYALALSWFLSTFMDVRPLELSSAELIESGLLVLAGLWLFSLQYAAAAQAFLNRRESMVAEKVQQNTFPAADPTELRALRNSREV